MGNIRNTISPRCREALNIIKARIEQDGRSPTRMELSEQMNVCVVRIGQLIEWLEFQGHIEVVRSNNPHRFVFCKD